MYPLDLSLSLSLAHTHTHTHTLLFSHNDYCFFIWYVGKQVLISAFKYFDNTGGFGSRVRECVTYIEESKFRCRAEVGDGRICDRNNINNESPFKQDYALCKLNLPVYVDDEEVKLELNFDPNFPSTGDDVIAIGFGSTRLGGPQTDFIRDVTLSVNSNRECRNADSEIYNPNSIGNESICASDPKGGKDTCRGDSGGRKFLCIIFGLLVK